MKEQKFNIISLSPSSKRYFPASMNKEDWMGDEYVKHTEIKIPLGQSRYGGPVLDLPEGLEVPKDMRFVAQLDLAVISKHSNLTILLYTLLDQNYDSFPILAFKALILFMTMSTGYLIYRWSYFVTQKSIEKRTLALAKISNNTVGLGLAAGLFWGLIGLFSIMSIVVVRTWEIT
jgi:hypothetical protein